MTFPTRLTSGLKLSSLLSIMAGVYTTQSLIGMFTLQGLPAVLKSQDVSTSQIGLFYLAILPWALKFLWSPYLEKIRKKGDTLKNHGYLVLFAQVAILVILGVLAFTQALHQLSLLFLCVFVLAMFSTIADMSTDGLAVDQLPRSKRRIGNVMQVGGAYLGAIFGGGLFIYLTGAVDWQVALFALMGLVIIMSLPTLQLFSRTTSQPTIKDVSTPSLKSAFSRSKVRRGLFLIMLCQIGTRGVLSMMMPFLYEKGINLENLGLLVAGGGALTGFIGVGLSGWAIKHITAIKMLTICLAVEAILYTGFFLYSANLVNIPYMLEVLFILNAVISAAKFLALYTLMMEWSYGSQAGIDYSLFQSMDMIVTIVMAVLCGWLISYLGYSAHYSLAIIATCFAAYQLTRISDLASRNTFSDGTLNTQKN